GGHYVATGGLNSSLTIDASDGRPGLGVQNWISNGTEMAAIAVAAENGNSSIDYIKQITPSVRLYPTFLEDSEPGGGGGRRQVFKALFEDITGPDNLVNTKPITADCGSWVGVTGVVWGRKPLDEFVFHLDQNGRVI